ncbi:hypothetical protein HK104_004157 [Borealophlyctis nickersoniae]|nr:hypothetical protein HK104_004157 [Borealophlyctis nickersoniae]
MVSQDLQTGRLKSAFDAHKLVTTTIVPLTASGDIIATGSGTSAEVSGYPPSVDKTVKIWDLRTPPHAPVHEWAEEGTVLTLTTPSSSTVASGAEIRAFASSGTPGIVYAAGVNKHRGLVDTWDLRPGLERLIHRTRASGMISSVSSSTDNNVDFTAPARLASCGWDGRVLLYDGEGKRVLRTLVADSSASFTSVRLGKRAMVASHMGGIVAYELGPVVAHRDPKMVVDVGVPPDENGMNGDEDAEHAYPSPLAQLRMNPF